MASLIKYHTLTICCSTCTVDYKSQFFLVPSPVHSYAASLRRQLIAYNRLSTTMSAASRATKIRNHRRNVLWGEYARILFYLAGITHACLLSSLSSLTIHSYTVPAGIASYYTDPEIMSGLIKHYQWVRHPPEDPRASAFLDGVMERRAKQTPAEKDFVEKELLEPDFRKIKKAREEREERERLAIIAANTKDLK